MAHSLEVALAAAGIDLPADEPTTAAYSGLGSSLRPPEMRETDDATRGPNWRQRFGVRDFGVSRHAAERYRERFGTDSDDLDAARDQLRARLDNGTVTFSRERPPWLVIVPRVGGQNVENSAGYVIVDDEIALPIRKGTSQTHPYYIVTCIARV